MSEKRKVDRKTSILRKILIVLAAASLVLFVVAFAAARYVYSKLKSELPDLSIIVDGRFDTGTRLYSYDGELIAEFSSKNIPEDKLNEIDKSKLPLASNGKKIFESQRIVVPFNRMPDKLVKALIAVEDRRFYRHHGVDFIGVLRALSTVYWDSGRKSLWIKQGGSTITQQLAQMYIGKEESPRRKIKDMIMATELEKRLTKEEILFLYLNNVYLGSKVSGVGSASIEYFGKNVWDLDLDEMAILAGLPKAPSGYNPRLYPERARERRDLVLKRMFDQGYITEDEYKEALAKPVKTSRQKNVFLEKAPYFCEKVRNYLLGGSISFKNAYDKVYREGLIVQTTVDMRATRLADEALVYGMRELAQHQGYKRGVNESYAAGGIVTRDAAEGGVNGELTNPLYHINLKNQLKEYLARHEDYFGKITEETIRRGTFYQGVVLETDSESVLVQVGGVKRSIYLRDNRWALKPYAKISGKTKKNNCQEEKNCFLKEQKPAESFKEVFVPGDVVLVRATDKEGLDDPDDFRNYKKKLGKEFFFVLEQIPSTQVAMIVKDPVSGYVKALAGGYDYYISEVDRTMHQRQPGDTVKPLIYALALDKGSVTPETLITDSGIEEKCRIRKESGAPVTVREALVKSIDYPAVKVLKDNLGFDNFVSGAEKLGIKSEIKLNKKSKLSKSCRQARTALGEGDIALTLDELTDAYSVFPDKGRAPHTTFIRKIYDKEGNILEDNTVYYDPYLSAPAKIDRLLHFATMEEKQAVSSETASIMNKLLEDAAKAQGAGDVLRAAGAAGTTDKAEYSWFIGYIPELLAGVSVGGIGDEQTELPFLPEGESKETAAALPIWKDFMKRYFGNFAFSNTGTAQP